MILLGVLLDSDRLPLFVDMVPSIQLLALVVDESTTAMKLYRSSVVITPAESLHVW
jgi:hypothetical protein